MNDCQVNRARVRGHGTKLPEMTVTRIEDGQQAWQVNTQGSNGNWFWQGNSFNCSTLGCGGGMYRIESLTPQDKPVCAQRITVSLTVN